MDIRDIDTRLKKKLERKRYEHTVGVMYTAASLCMCYGTDVEKGLLAGLLHDCGKQYKEKKQYELCKEYGIKLKPIEEENQALIHAKLGSYLAENKYLVDDIEVLSAIASHTTGKPNMGILDMILYISDYIEPYRNLPHLDKVRQMAFKSLEQTMLFLLEDSITHLKKEEKIIDSLTIETYEYFKNLCKNNNNNL